jgi:hypothetical protein
MSIPRANAKSQQIRATHCLAVAATKDEARLSLHRRDTIVAMRLTSSLCLLGALTIGCGGPAAGPDTGPREPLDAAIDDLDAASTTSFAELAPDTWSFVPIAGAVCGNGTPLSVGVNPHAGASDVLVIVMGGGACWNAETCFTLDAATHVHEDYTRAIFDRERALVSMVGWDDRAALLNPFREAHLVFVPYCSGDLHAGDSVQDYPGAPQTVHHRGAPNTQRIIDAMHGAWPELARVRVIGFSAGGYGTQLNWGRYADAWPDADLALLADCSPLLAPPDAQYAAWRTSWNLYTPEGCAECESRFSAYDDFFDQRYPDSRFGLLATTNDSVITAFWGVPDIAPLYDPLLDTLDDNATTRYFVVDSDAHVILGQAGTLRSADGTLMIDWLLGWLENDPVRFHNTRP